MNLARTPLKGFAEVIGDSSIFISDNTSAVAGAALQRYHPLTHNDHQTATPE